MFVRIGAAPHFTANYQRFGGGVSSTDTLGPGSTLVGDSRSAVPRFEVAGTTKNGKSVPTRYPAAPHGCGRAGYEASHSSDGRGFPIGARLRWYVSR